MITTVLIIHSDRIYITLKFAFILLDIFSSVAATSQMNQAEAFKTIQASLNYFFKKQELLKEALTHDSNRVNDRTAPTYQRLEFLGDSVLNFIISDYIFRNNSDFNEGQLTNKRIELTEALKQLQIAEKLNIKEYILFGQSVNRNQFSRHHSFVESLIGAVYIDGGLGNARDVIYKLWELSDKPAPGSNCVIS